MSKLRVTGLELKTKRGQKVELTLEEARELHEQLDELFGNTKEIINHYPYSVWPTYQPHWWGKYTVAGGSSCGTYNTGKATSNTQNISLLSNTTGMQSNFLTEKIST